MASCAYCNTTILFGGKKQGALRFCNAECQQRGALASVASQISKHEVDSFVFKVHQGACPRCMGVGPIDVHTSYRVYSALFFTSWSSRPVVCCKNCGTKRKLGDSVFSVLLGWWGIPWGILVTPLQIGRNIFGFFRAQDPSIPSPALEKLLRLNLAEQMLAAQNLQEPAA